MQDPALQRVDGRGKREIVQVAQDDDLGARVQGQNAVDEVIDDLRLLGALDFGTEHRWLEAAKEWIVAALGIEVISDENQLLAAKGELARQWFPAAVESSVSRIDAARAEGKLNSRWAICHCRSAG